MQIEQITVQPCGCIALPEQLGRQLGILPGAVLSVAWQQDKQVVELRVCQTASESGSSARAACPIAS